MLVGGYAVVEPLSHHSPDFVMRVFMLPFCDVLYTQALGEVEYYTYAIEFQKTGLPHVHMGLGMKRGSKLTCGRNIDAVISVEMPDPIKELVLFDLKKQ